MFRIVRRGIWSGLHAGQALPASETLPAGVDPTPLATRRLQAANQNSAGTMVNYMVVPYGVRRELQRNNNLLLDEATQQHSRENL